MGGGGAPESYAVVWSEEGGAAVALGELELHAFGCTLTGRLDGTSTVLEFGPDAVRSVALAERPEAQLAGSPTIVIGLAGRGLVSVAPVLGRDAARDLLVALAWWVGGRLPTADQAIAMLLDAIPEAPSLT